jgi:hypothetical protein
VLGHQLGQDLILRLDLLFQVGDPLLVGGVVGCPLLLEGGRAVLEELLLPAVDDRGLQAEFIAELRDGLLLQQMSPQDGDLLSTEPEHREVLGIRVKQQNHIPAYSPVVDEPHTAALIL